MQNAVDRVKVIFRRWPNGDVIALFPNVPWDQTGLVSSYMHVGQHGGADYIGIIRTTVPATPIEYASLKRELETKPYEYRLLVCERRTR